MPSTSNASEQSEGDPRTASGTRPRVRFDERLDSETTALVALGRALRVAGYSFTTVTPETHRRVDARAGACGRFAAQSLRDVFGWSRPFERDLLPATMLELATEAGVIERVGDLCRATVRFSSMGPDLFVHSAYPTNDTDAVFFGPDTYRFCNLIRAEAAGASRVVDVGCGSGVGGILAARMTEGVVLADVNRAALRFARVNARLAGVSEKVRTVESDLLRAVEDPVDLVIANPPYLADGASRTYRDGGGGHGEELGLRIVRESLERLVWGGRLVLYTGAAIVDGEDTFLRQVRPLCEEGGATWRYSEIDPDVFGEEIERNDAYADVERIAAVALIMTVR